MNVLTRPAVDASCGVAPIDVSGPLPDLLDIPPLGVRSLVRLGPRPVGFLDVRGPSGLPAAALATAIWSAVGPQLVDRCRDAGVELQSELTEDGIELPATLDPARVESSITVVIATRDRPATLERCLASVRATRPGPAEVIVVDNAPSDDRTRELVQRSTAPDTTLTYVREPRPGLGRAHNAALPLVATEYVAFTDDDVAVDTHWVGAMASAFRTTPDTACVTGLIAPAELVTPEQWWVERGNGFAKGFHRRVRSMRSGEPEGVLFPFDAGTMGSGANMAFSTAFLVERGGFDVTLGTGTRSLGGDDLEALHDVVASGHDLVYEPGAIVFHRHHAQRALLERQAVGYGAGLTAYLASTVLRHPQAAVEIGRRIVPGTKQVFARTSPLNDRRPADYPRSLVWRERAGMATGPARYLLQRTIDRRNDRRNDRRGTAP